VGERRLQSLLCSLAVALLPGAASAQLPDWAFPASDRFLPQGVLDATVVADDAERARVEKEVTADPRIPQVVKVRKSDDVARCMGCHLPSGLGQPQTAPLAGLPAAYIAQQMADFASGSRTGYRSENMIRYARGLDATEVNEVAAYYASLPHRPWTTVREVETVPKTYVGEREIRTLVPGGGTEPLGDRIIEIAADPASLFRPEAPAYVTYVPRGAIAKGEMLVTSGGGTTTACTTCHGADLRGIGDVPALAGRSAVHAARQIYQFQGDQRRGPRSTLMAEVVAQLQAQDIIAIVAYLASRPPM